MHKIAVQAGGLQSAPKLNFKPAEVLFISTADSDLYQVAQVWGPKLGTRLQLVPAAGLQNAETAVDFCKKVAVKARLIVCRLHGGAMYFEAWLNAVQQLKNQQRIILPATEEWEDSLLFANTLASNWVKPMFDYFQNGGHFNLQQALKVAEALLLGQQPKPQPYKTTPNFGFWAQNQNQPAPTEPAVWVLFYRSFLLSEDILVVSAMLNKLESLGLPAIGFYAYSIKDKKAQQALKDAAKKAKPLVVINLQSFAVESQDLFLNLDRPILQAILSNQSKTVWQNNLLGLEPTNTAMNVALPEMDGKLITTAIGFKETIHLADGLQVRQFVADSSQINFVAELAFNWCRLQQKPNSQKKIAIILANYPTKNSRIGNGVGLDTQQSLVLFLKQMQQTGYTIGNIPKNSQQLMQWLQQGITNDSENNYGKPSEFTLNLDTWQAWFAGLPTKNRQSITQKWNAPTADIPIAGQQTGNVFIGIQPPRGFGLQTQAIYHDPKLPPPPVYLAFYYWLRQVFEADAIIHFGKHGNLEWLPGRSLALSNADFPQLVLGPIPHLYPFIVNNPGEGAQAKRRTSAVIVDHLTPPLTRAGLYGDLMEAERLLEEHAHAETMHPERATLLEHQIAHFLAEKASFKHELPTHEDELTALSNYLCVIKERQIRSGLHLFGQPPVGEKQIDFLLSLLRLPYADQPSLLEALGETKDSNPQEQEQLYQTAKVWVKNAIHGQQPAHESTDLKHLRLFLQQTLLPKLAACTQETKHLLKGLNGQFVPPGTAGSPSRGRVDVLPTGANFYSIDPRILPTKTAWNCGRTLAENLLKRHLQDQQTDLKTLAMVIWATSNMRTGGDDIAQALWLWGCKPVWDSVSGRVVDFAILPLDLLNRPRVDIVLRISGMFRDAFGHCLQLLASIPERLAELDEPPDQNPIRAAWLADTEQLKNTGMQLQQAQQLAKLRVFSSGPGCYGAGLLPLIDAKNWKTKADLAQVFLKWGAYAYDSKGTCSQQINLLKQQLGRTSTVSQNQDNYDHDILDADDYFQFQGGLKVTIEHLSQQAPLVYHGDSSDPSHPATRSLQEEFNLVLRSRVLNPKWLQAMRQHSYKGALEMAATIDYFFGYDATCNLASDSQYEDLAQALLLDPEQQSFFEQHNPQALKESCERLLEAAERDMWVQPKPETLTQLEALWFKLQGSLE